MPSCESTTIWGSCRAALLTGFKYCAACIVVVVLPWTAALPVRAQSQEPAALLRRVEAIEAKQRLIEKEIERINALLETAGYVRPDALGIKDVQPPGILLGSALRTGGHDARVVLVEFSDLQCPFCGDFARGTLKQILRDYVDKGKVLFAFRHFPLENTHPQAFASAEAVECAARSGKGWEMHDRLFQYQQSLAAADLERHAEILGLDRRQFRACLADEMGGRVRQDVNDAIQLGVNSTPTFFIGIKLSDGNLRLLRRIVGALPYAVFQKALDDAQAEQQDRRH